VKECPTNDTSIAIECSETSWMRSNPTKYDGCSYYPEGKNTGIKFSYTTKAVGRFCLPSGLGSSSVNMTVDVVETIKKAFFATSWGEKVATYFYDVIICWPMLIAGSVIALILGYVYLFVMRCLGGAIVWLMIILTEACLLAAGGYCWYIRTKKYTPEDQPAYKYLAIASYVLWALSGLIIIAMFCCCSAIKIGIAVMKATSKFVAGNLRIFLIPLSSYIFLALWGGLWCLGGLWLYTCGYAHPREGFEFSTEIMWDKATKPVIVYYIFGLFWVNSFIIGMTQFIIAAAAVIWYFDQGSDKKTDCVGTGIKWVWRYHLGTIALGSMIIAICQTIRAIFEYYRRKIQSAAPSKLVKALLCLTSYLLYCLEKCIKFITKNAYIQCAVTSDNFCTSAWNAFTLMIKNAARFGWGNSIGFIMVVFGCTGIGALTAFVCYIFIAQTTYFPVSSPIAPAFAIGIIAMFIAWVFLAIFSFSSDALLQAFLLDEELRFAGKSRPIEFAEFEEDFKKRSQSCC